MGIEEENQKIEETMRDVAKKLLQDKEVDVILGYTKGTLPLRSSPITISNPDNIDQLVWNNLCYINLAKYLAPPIPQLRDKKVEKEN